MCEIFFDPSDHTYTNEYGISFIPVTKVISITPRAINFKALPYQDKVKKAAERGTLLHAEIENFIDNGDIGLFPSTEWFSLNLYPKYVDWESEVIVHSYEANTSYAGTIDAIARDGEDYLLFDFKFGGHETVDYQLSLYKRALCKMRDISPDKVKLFCVDMHDESNYKVIPVRTIDSAWLDNLLYCYENGELYTEPHQELETIEEDVLFAMESIETEIVSLEKTLSNLTTLKEKYRKDLYEAMIKFGLPSFDFGSIHATVVKPSIKTEFNLEDFKAKNPDVDINKYSKEVVTTETDIKALQKDFPKEYLKSTSERQTRSGYLKVTISDMTEAV